jgi:hypothetical protein
MSQLSSTTTIAVGNMDIEIHHWVEETAAR